MSEKDDGASQLEEGEIVLGIVFPANDEPSKVVQPGEEAFDFPALGVATQAATVIEGGLGAATAVRGQKQDLFFEQSLPQRVAIIGLISNEAQRFFFHQPRGQGRLHQLHFGRRSSFCVDGERKTMSICNGHDFTALAPLGIANFSAPFLAAEKLPSRKHSLKSKPPRSCKSLANPRSTASITPCWRQA